MVAITGLLAGAAAAAAGAAAGAGIASGVTNAINENTANEVNKSGKAGQGANLASTLGGRVTQYITQGGKPEYQNSTETPRTYTVYNQPFAKQYGSDFGTFEFYKADDGSYTRDLSKVANISMDSDGKVTVTVPDKWADDEKVKAYIDSTYLKKISGNYRNNKDVEYADPYDETKKYKTQELIEKLNEGLKVRIGSLDAKTPIKTNLMHYFGGSEKKNAAIDGITADDVIIMTLNYKDDDSWVPLPEYMLLAYPQLKELSTYTNGFVQKKDFLDNFYNIESGKITEANAYGIATAWKKMLNSDDISSEELAKTYGFGRFISGVDPKRSPISQFLQAGDALSRGFYGGIYNWITDTSNLVANAVNLSWITGESVDAKAFIDGIVGADRKGYDDYNQFLSTSMEQMAATNKDALDKTQAGFVQGMIAGKAADALLTVIGVDAVANAAKTAMVYKGAQKIAAQEAATFGELSSEGSLVGAKEGLAAKDLAAMQKAATGVYAKNAAYQSIFTMTASEASILYSRIVGSTEVALKGLTATQLASAVNSAAKVATSIQWANTAMNVLSSLTIAAVVGNKELTTKVLSGKATSDEAKSLITQSIFGAAMMNIEGWALGVIDSRFGMSQKLGKMVDRINEFFSQKVTGATAKITSPWLNFMKWMSDSKAAAAAAKGATLSNAAISQREAIKEAILAKEARTYGANLSRTPGSYGTKLIQQALAEAGVEAGENMAQDLARLAQAGITFDPATLGLSEYEGWQADFAELQNLLTKWTDVSTNISQVVSEFSNPDIQPVISQQLSEVNKANTKMLNAEKEAGLLSNVDIKANKRIGKDDAGYIYQLHSPELSRYIVRKYELDVITNEAAAQGIKGEAALEEYQPYAEARERYLNAKEAVPEELRNIVDTEYLPALKKAEHNIIDVMVSDGVYPREFVEGIRASGKYGTDGSNWLRLVARKDLPKGVYDPYSGTVKRDNTIALGSFKVLPDEDITWVGNGLQELITEYGIARAEKKFLETAKKATGVTTDVQISGEETAGASKMDEFKKDLDKAVKQGFRSFTEDVEGTTAVGKKRAIQQKAFYDEVSKTGAVSSMDIDTLRGVMKEKGVATTEDVVDQKTLDELYDKSSVHGKQIITDKLGKKIDTTLPEGEEEWRDFWSNASPSIKKILRGELKKTSLDTGYGIKDTRGRLNSQVPGFDVLDWSLLGREHVNGLAPEIGYAGMDNYGTKAYLMDLDFLRSITGLDNNKQDMSPDAIRKIEKDINTRGAGAVLPLHYKPVDGQNKFFMQTRWGHSGDRFPDWETYFNYLEEKGIKKVPVALSYDMRSLGHDAISWKFFEKLDNAIATAKKPEFTVEEIAVALRTLATKDRVARRIKSAYPNYDDTELDELLTKGEQYNNSVALGFQKDSFDGVDFDNQLNEAFASFAPGEKFGAKDITSDLQKAFSEYGEIPLYHNQHAPLGSVEPNDTSRFPTTREGKLFDNGGAGDALWLAPNSSYTDTYGENKVVGTIPVKYFISDKAKNAEIRKIYDRLVELEGKLRKALDASDLAIKNDSELANATLSRLYDAEREGLAENLELLYPGELKEAKNILEKALTKKELKEYKELSNILDLKNITGNGIVEADRHSIKSYRALAERLGKPIIDISEDGWADGTAYFYFKEVSPEFDERLGKQLQTQAKAGVNGGLSQPGLPEAIADKMVVDWTKKTSLGEFLSTIKEKIPSTSQEVDAVMWILRDGLKNVGSMQGLSSMMYDVQREASKYAPEIGHAMMIIGNRIWSEAVKNFDLNTTVADMGISPERFYNEHHAEDFLKEIGYDDPNAMSPEEIESWKANRADWDVIDPQNFANVPTRARFRQPKEVSYEDYQKGVEQNGVLPDMLKQSLANTQYSRLEELRNENPAEYEQFMGDIDRANAIANSDVKNSEIVKDAADEYRANIKDMEDTTIFTEQFSYITELPTPKGTLKEFVENNNLDIPDDKRPLTGKVKHALWEKVQNGEPIPTIKGVKKSDISKDMAKEDFYKLLDSTELFRNPGGANSMKYDLDSEALYNDIDDAIDGMMELIRDDVNAELALKGKGQYKGTGESDARFEFDVLTEVLSEDGKKDFAKDVETVAKKVVDGVISKKRAVIKGNLDSLYKKVETAVWDKLEARFAAARAELQARGEDAENETVTELLKGYRERINTAEKDELVVKTTDRNGEIRYEKVSPAIAAIYNSRPIYKPAGNFQRVLNNLALIKKINTTDLNPRSFFKQSFSDPALGFATVGALPGTLQVIRNDIEARFGSDVLHMLEKIDPIRRKNISLIAQREGISDEAALARNLKAIAETEVPFALLNNEILAQARNSKYGNKVSRERMKRSLDEKINDGLRKVADKLGTPNNKRETYNRILQGEAAYRKALMEGYGAAQAEIFREYAINTATTNFRQKHIVFNLLRSTVPYLTSGISGAKSFWKMFELDPVGVTSRITTGFIIPIIYFMGEIMSDEEAKKKYEALSEGQKDNHIAIYVGGQLILVPVGEEMGQITNLASHLVESLDGLNKYSFWSLMMNDLVNLIPGIDLTGFTDPEMWGSLAGTPSIWEVLENGVGKALAGTTPPVFQTWFMLQTGRDLYTGKKINTSYIKIDEEGNPQIMTSSDSEFAKALANVVGGDPRVLEKATSGLFGTVGLHLLDTITSAVDFISSGGEEGSSTTAFDKAISDATRPFSSEGYDTLEKRFSSEISSLFDKKENITKSDMYIKYNQEIAKEKDPERRQSLKSKRNDLLADFYKDVETVVKNYRDAGGSLDKWNFSKVVALITFEDAVRADRTYLNINTTYNDAYKQAMQTLYDMGIQNPDGPSTLGYVYTDDDGKPQIAMWNPTQIQIVQDIVYGGRDVSGSGAIYRGEIQALLEDGTAESIKNQYKAETEAEQPYWDKYHATGKLSEEEWDALDELKKAYNAQVVLKLNDYMKVYGAANVLSNDSVIEYLKGMIKVPSEYETIKGRNISSENGKLDKQEGFAESYIKKIFGVTK